MATMAADSNVQAWWALTDAMQEPTPEREPGSWWLTMPEIFRLDWGALGAGRDGWQPRLPRESRPRRLYGFFTRGIRSGKAAGGAVLSRTTSLVASSTRVWTDCSPRATARTSSAAATAIS